MLSTVILVLVQIKVDCVVLVLVQTFGQDRVGVTFGTVRVLDSSSWDVFNEFTVNLRFWISTGGVTADHCVTGQIQDGRKQT